jgi:hypothetical protein
MVLPHVLVVNEDTPGQALASLGNAKWAALGWPVTAAGEQDGRGLYKFAPNGKVAITYRTVTRIPTSTIEHSPILTSFYSRQE